MSNGVRSNRYVGGGASGPAQGKFPPAVGDSPGTARRSIKKGKGGSTKKRRPARKK